MKRIERKSNPRKCPTCGHSPVGKILWGMPRMDDKLQELMEAGKIICDTRKSSNKILTTWWVLRIRSALGPIRSVLETRTRPWNLASLAALIKLSISDFLMLPSGAKHFACTAQVFPDWSLKTRSIPQSGPHSDLFGCSSHHHTSLTWDFQTGSVLKNHLTNFSNCFPLMPESGSNDW